MIDTLKNPIKTSFHQWSSLQAQLFWAYGGAVPDYLRDLEVDHSHGNWLWLIREGRVRIRAGSGECSARAGQWLLCPTGKLRQEFSADAKILSVHFLCQWPTGEPLVSAKKGVVFSAQQHPRLTKSAETLQRLTRRHFPGVRVMMFEQNTSLDVFLRMQQSFLVFLTELTRALNTQDNPVAFEWPTDRRVARGIQLLNQSPLSAPLPMERLLKSTGWQALDGNPDIGKDSIALVNTNGAVGARVNNNTSFSSAGFLPPDTTCLMVIQYTGWTGAHYSTVNLWINPIAGKQSDNTISIRHTDATPGGGSSGFLGIYVRTVIDSYESFLVDDLRVGTDWASVTSFSENAGR